MLENRKYLKKFIIISIILIICFAVLRIDIVKEKANNIDFSNEIYNFDHHPVLGKDYISYDLRKLEKIEFITIFPEYNSNIPVEKQAGVIKLTKEDEYKNIINSFKDFTTKGENQIVIEEGMIYTKMIIKIDESTFYDISVYDNTIEVLLNREFINVRVYYSENNFEEFIKNELNELLKKN